MAEDIAEDLVDYGADIPILTKVQSNKIQKGMQEIVNEYIPSTLQDLFEYNGDVRNLVAKGNRLPLRNASKKMKEMLPDVPVIWTIPSADEISFGPALQDRDCGYLEKKWRYLEDEVLLEKDNMNVVSLFVDCDKQRVEDILEEDFIMTPAENSARELRFYYANMRLVSDFIRHKVYLTTLHLSYIVIDGVMARMIGDMLRQSSHVTNFTLKDVTYETPLMAIGGFYLEKSCKRLTSLTLQNIDLSRYTYINSDWIHYIFFATNLTSLSLIGCSIDTEKLMRIMKPSFSLDLRKLHSLHTIDLSGNVISSVVDHNSDTPAQSGLYEYLPLMTQITTLNLSDNQLPLDVRQQLNNTRIGNTRLICPF